MEEFVTVYQTGIKRVLSEYQRLQTQWSEVELIFDDERRHYMAYRVGWFKHKRIHCCLAHIDVCDDIVIIQANNTEDMLDEELIEQGIPQEKMCLGLLPPDVREYLTPPRNHERQDTRSAPVMNAASSFL